MTLLNISCSFVVRNNKSFEGNHLREFLIFSGFKPRNDTSIVVPYAVSPNQPVCKTALTNYTVRVLTRRHSKLCRYTQHAGHLTLTVDILHDGSLSGSLDIESGQVCVKVCVSLLL